MKKINNAMASGAKKYEANRQRNSAGFGQPA
jgi:hypothetical protein